MIKLSYILTTYNKLPYLKEVIKELIESCKDDEEIIVTDGASTDGTANFLQALFKEGKIHQFISEKDFGESHGFNKAIFLAQGELIKPITDDDVFHYPSIEACKKFMLSNFEVDILNTSGGWCDVTNLNIHEFTGIYVDFFKNKWMVDGHPFAHCALGIMLRKSSLAKTGLLRITSSKVNFYWYTGVAYVRVLNAESNSVKMKLRIEEETERLSRFYGFDIDKLYENPSQQTTVGKMAKREIFDFKKMFNFFKGKTPLDKKLPLEIENSLGKLDFGKVYINAENWLTAINDRENKFIGNDAKD
jgi:glycosyltransferase involved in cell wall biosynthesis